MSKKYYQRAKIMLRIAVFYFLFGISLITQAEEPKIILSAEEIDALIPEVEAAEEKPFLNLKVESELWVETKADLSDPNEPWQRTPIYVSCTGWFGGGSNKDKKRVDVHKQVLRWQEGAAPYIEESYSVGFNGQHGRILRHTTTHSGKTHHTKKGKLQADVPEQLKDNFLGSCTGEYFTFSSFFNSEAYRTFSKLFRACTTPAALEAKAFECALEEFQGIPCIKFGSGEKPWGRESWWIDQSRGFSLLGYEHITTRDGNDRLISRIKIEELKEVADGIWWPMEVSSISRPYEAGKPWRRFVYRASNVVANAPDFDENVFTITFPDGYTIDDQVLGKKYRVGEE